MNKSWYKSLTIIAALVVIGCLLMFVAGCKDDQPLHEWHTDQIIKEMRYKGYYVKTMTFELVKPRIAIDTERRYLDHLEGVYDPNEYEPLLFNNYVEIN